MTRYYTGPIGPGGNDYGSAKTKPPDAAIHECAERISGTLASLHAIREITALVAGLREEMRAMEMHYTERAEVLVARAEAAEKERDALREQVKALEAINAMVRTGPDNAYPPEDAP